MAMVNAGGDFDDLELKNKDGRTTKQDISKTPEPVTMKSTIQRRTTLEKVLLVVAFIALILCIIFMVLFAKERNDNDTDSSRDPTKDKLKGSPPILTSELSGKNYSWTLSCAATGDPKPVIRINVYNESGDLIEQIESNQVNVGHGKSYQCSAYNDLGVKVGKVFKMYSKPIQFNIDKGWKAAYADTNSSAYKVLRSDVMTQVESLYPKNMRLSFHDMTFSSGSIKVSFTLTTLTSYMSDLEKPITSAIENNTIGTFSVSKYTGQDDDKYIYSEEADRVGLQQFLLKVQKTYYEYTRFQSPWKPIETDESMEEMLKERHRTYNTTPAYIKEKTDVSFALLKELSAIKMDEEKMTPREVKAVEQVRHFLQTVFGSPYDGNFYNGDWMLGPNHFCWQPMCSISYHFNAFGHYVKIRNIKDLKIVLGKIMMNKETILQYKANMQLGVRTGMVRSIHTCKSGLDAFKQEFSKISENNDPQAVLSTWFVNYYLQDNFVNISKAEEDEWIKEKGMSAKESVNDTIVKGIGEPIIELINYMSGVHIHHCLPQDHASGLANLPVDYIFWDGVRTNNRTTKRLPLTNITLDGGTSYKNMLPYFTTSDITPKRVNEIGHERLRALYPQVVDIAKSVTNISNETEAVQAFREKLKGQENYYNVVPIPEIESNATAHQRCRDRESAEKYCPTRWAALLIWENTCRQVTAMLSPKIIPLFYHTGKRITVPNCPLEMVPSFNPSSGAQFFMNADAKCTRPAYFGLPFFLENLGPRFSEWSVTAHEGWPGHHTQVQGQIEYFKDPYGGVPKWIDDQTYYTFFTEGWGLYAENPVIGEFTDTYKNNPLQKYGMLKWQVWRALRLIVDTGMHYYGMNRTEALGYFAKYAWDETDLARKEITRYQGAPGQATAYMLGQQKIYELLNLTKTELGDKFNIQDFHYQTLSQGSAPESYLVKHINKYIECTLGKREGKQCDVILNPVKKSSPSTSDADAGPPKPPKKHYH